ncbi:hypothetical protein Pan44_04330 [Caulifigura coniformis]|uniref:DUF1488 domain-containing protein n=1 Tax=Caulifigura coniformis TaxID=2527983 RepID=A0A517S8H9_9PLAN|nr:DUF1488 family protein [Caulifigura coniformis]QDT52422.1 hypothetical protein Pan44_04330 [Caulifigura coniformis]
MASPRPQRVSFFPYSEWDADREAVAFIALVDGQRARCIITPAALSALASSPASTSLETYSDHRDAVEKLATALILEGRLDGRELMIHAADATRWLALQAEQAPLSAAEAQVEPPAQLPPESLIEPDSLTETATADSSPTPGS